MGAATCVFVSFTTLALGQTSAGPVVVGSVATVYANGGIKPSFSGSVGYRFNRAFTMGVELTRADLRYTPAPETSVSPSGLFTTVVSYENPKLDALFFTTNVRIEIPTPSRRVLLYGVGGGGVSTGTKRYTVTITDSVVGRPTMTETEPRTVQSSTILALTLGGGISLLATDHVSMEVDGRNLYGRGSSGGSIGRFGVGLSYRF
jgi:opacity protein-like surface antigen